MKANLEAEKMEKPPRRQGGTWINGNKIGYYFHQSGAPAGPPPVGNDQEFETEREAAISFLWGLGSHDIAALEIQEANEGELALVAEKKAAPFVANGHCNICGKTLNGQSSLMAKIPATNFGRQQVCIEC